MANKLTFEEWKKKQEERQAQDEPEVLNPKKFTYEEGDLKLLGKREG